MIIQKLQQLRSIFNDMERALIAYSGGIDSTLVAKIAHDVLGEKSLAGTALPNLKDMNVFGAIDT